MITSEIVEALKLFESLLPDGTWKETALAVREMLCEWSEDEWMRMDDPERQKWLHTFLPIRPDIT